MGEDAHIDELTRTKASASVEPVGILQLVDLDAFPIIGCWHLQCHDMRMTAGLASIGESEGEGRSRACRLWLFAFLGLGWRHKPVEISRAGSWRMRLGLKVASGRRWQMARRKGSRTLDPAVRRYLSSRPIAYITSGLIARMMQR